MSDILDRLDSITKRLNAASDRAFEERVQRLAHRMERALDAFAAAEEAGEFIGENEPCECLLTGPGGAVFRVAGCTKSIALDRARELCQDQLFAEQWGQHEPRFRPASMERVARDDKHFLQERDSGGYYRKDKHATRGGYLTRMLRAAD